MEFICPVLRTIRYVISFLPHAERRQFCGSVYETHNPQIWKNSDKAICALADQVSITSQNRNTVASAYSVVHVAVPYSNAFQSSAFCA
jgi:hypothetical protein